MILRALDLGGPTKFYRDVGERLPRLPKEAVTEFHEKLRQRSAWRHVVADGLAIRDGIMKTEERRKELDAIARRVNVHALDDDTSFRTIDRRSLEPLQAAFGRQGRPLDQAPQTGGDLLL